MSGGGICEPLLFHYHNYNFMLTILQATGQVNTTLVQSTPPQAGQVASMQVKDNKQLRDKGVKENILGAWLVTSFCSHTSIKLGCESQ